MAPRVLLLGGHGRVSQMMTPCFLARSWNVTSVVRTPDHTDEILALGKDQPGKLDVLVRSLDDITSDKAAQSVLDDAKPDYVVWSAGAGGKGGPERTFAIDRDAAKHFISASVRSPSITKFLMVSSQGARNSKPSWWSAEDWAMSEKWNTEKAPTYHDAKVEADQYLAALSRQRKGHFQAISLRPGALTDDKPTGMVALGKGPNFPAKGDTPRGQVAETAAALLATEEATGWIDLAGGSVPLDQAVERVCKEDCDCIEGEDVEAMIKKFPL